MQNLLTIPQGVSFRRMREIVHQKCILGFFLWLFQRPTAEAPEQIFMHTHTFIRNRNEPYLPLPSQPQLVLIYRPRRDGRLSRPWCEVAQAEIRTCNLPIANPALYHTATSAGSAGATATWMRSMADSTRNTFLPHIRYLTGRGRSALKGVDIDR